METPRSLTVSIHAQQIARAKETRQERAAAGLCVVCAQPHQGPPKKCRACTAKSSQAQWRWKQGQAKSATGVRGWNFETDDLITEHVFLARRMAYGVASRQFSSSTVDVDDVVGDALYGLVLAGRTYDASYGKPFGAWAATQIKGEIYAGIRRWVKRHKVRPVFVPLKEPDDDSA